HHESPRKRMSDMKRDGILVDTNETRINPEGSPEVVVALANDGLSIKDAVERIETSVESDDGDHDGGENIARLLNPSERVGGVSGLEPGVGDVHGRTKVAADLAHATSPRNRPSNVGGDRS
ncbi:hypothetical protein, partial [Kitasatospora herbaricolor]|uniref:hypothetical protein n=1 Tax=Kitasatospora herbaricolor TaxID=68217 RepID=UPI0036D8B726